MGGFLALLVNGLLLPKAERPGYELQPLAGVPSVCWLLLAAAFLSGTLMALQERRGQRTAGTTVLLLAALQVFQLPIYLGFEVAERLDQMTYVGQVRHIITEGEIVQTNIYPLVHIVVAALSDVAGLTILESALVASIVFSIVWVLAATALGEAVIEKAGPHATRWVLPLACAPILGWYHSSIAPHFFGFVLLPLFAYTVVKQRQVGFVPALLLAGALALVHPLVVPFSAAMLFTWFVASDDRRYYGTLMACFGVAAAAWIVFSTRFDANLIQLVSLAGAGGYVSASEDATAKAARAQPGGLDLMNLGLFYVLRYLALAVATIGIAWRLLRRERSWRRAFWNYAPLASLLALAGTIQIAHIATNTLAHTILRFINLNLIFILAAPLLALWIALIARSNPTSHRTALAATVAIGLVLTSAGMIDSPLAYRPSTALEANELVAARWLMDQTSDSRQMQAFAIDSQFVNRAGALLIHPDYGRTEDTFTGDSYPGDHFELLRADDASPSWFVETQMGISMNLDLYDEVDRFTAEDLAWLRSAPTMSRIYSGLDVNIYSANWEAR